MFIQIGGISGAYYNIQHIASYRNLWKKIDKEYVKNGCLVSFSNGDNATFEDHVDVRENDSFVIVPAQDGWVAIDAYKEEDDKFGFSISPIIAWKIDRYGSTPITSTTSHEEYATATHPWGWQKTGDDRVFHFGSIYDSQEAFLKEAQRKLA